MRKENKIYCNSCGKRIVDTIGRDMEEYIHIEKIWGYPSEKDGECHSFDLCEPCYDKLTAAFETRNKRRDRAAVEKKEETKEKETEERVRKKECLMFVCLDAAV